ncbi:MAG: DNA-3-methyladenine glycosylase 2 family protein [Geodermatophilaceae bacterium]|jgi:AraC family transcriptional regulator of adaptative response / DNA-3-methyladenine glycosylase II|nr:DNA-3-methyladenine glycosylase 2 family protein [Geodermatophilaceae bacterium]
MLTDQGLDSERCYRAVSSRDGRFDGWFFVGVHTTGIYCRPSCPARTPLPHNVSYYPVAAAAQAAGFRACRRCRPDAAPGSPEWNVRADAVGRAMRLIADGTVDRVGVPGLAAVLGYSERHLHRLLVAELGVGALGLARAQRAQTARVLIETTEMSFADVTFAAGFRSIRQFNETVRAIFARTPGELRSGSRTARTAPGVISLRLAHRAPYDQAALLAFFAGHQVREVEEVVGGTYRRVLDLAHGPATVELTPQETFTQCVLRLDDVRDLPAAVASCRRILDADSDPIAVHDALRADPVLGPLIARRPGLRVPGAADAAELAVRAVIGQQVSIAGAMTLTSRLVRTLGTSLTTPDSGLTHIFPRPEAIAGADLSGLGMTNARQRTLHDLAGALAEGSICLAIGVDRREAVEGLQRLRGIGPWTAAYVAMRGLSDPDVFLGGDLILRRALDALAGEGSGRCDSDQVAVAPIGERAANDRALSWRPWRSYAVMHLWVQQTADRASRPSRKPETYAGPALPAVRRTA